MFERFTDDARQVVVLAQDEARSLGHDWIGSEHLLLALVRSGMPALADLDIESVRAAVVELVGVGEAQPSGKIPFTPAAKRALEGALREAIRLGSAHRLAVEHLALGVLGLRDGTSARVIERLGVDVPAIVSRLDVGVDPARFEPVAYVQVEPRWGRPGAGVVQQQPDPLERFTERARRAIVRSEAEARALGHREIGPEHLLVGVLRVEESGAARALTSLGVGVEGVRARLQPAATVDVSPETLPFSPRTKGVLERALLDALSLGHNYIGAEHLVLGLAREEGGLVGRLFADAGLDGKTIVDAVLRELAGGRSHERLRLTSPPFSDEALDALESTNDTLLRVAAEALQRAWQRRRQS